MKKGKKDVRVYLQDILSAIERIKEYTTEGKKVFLAETLVQDGVIRQLSIIGEAASKLPVALKAKHKTIPWKNIIGMRNILIHEYSETDIPTIWNTIEKDLPVFMKEILHMLVEVRNGH